MPVEQSPHHPPPAASEQLPSSSPSEIIVPDWIPLAVTRVAPYHYGRLVLEKHLPSDLDVNARYLLTAINHLAIPGQILIKRTDENAQNKIQRALPNYYMGEDGSGYLTLEDFYHDDDKNDGRPPSLKSLFSPGKPGDKVIDIDFDSLRTKAEATSADQAKAKEAHLVQKEIERQLANLMIKDLLKPKFIEIVHLLLFGMTVSTYVSLIALLGIPDSPKKASQVFSVIPSLILQTSIYLMTLNLAASFAAVRNITKHRSLFDNDMNKAARDKLVDFLIPGYLVRHATSFVGALEFIWQGKTFVRPSTYDPFAAENLTNTSTPESDETP